MIYFDNAATSRPKPAAVLKAMNHFMEEIGASPGRSGHRLSIEAGRIIYETREALATLFNVPDPLHIVFGSNATTCLNLALKGLLHPGDHVVVSSLEHNAAMRPLRALEREGVGLTVVPCSPQGHLDPAAVEAALRPNTMLIALTHSSNVTGSLLPIAEVGHIARRRGLLFLADAAQTAGAIPIDVEAQAIDLLAFTGHKALYGPTGTGGLVIGPRVDLDRLAPLVRGGTGSRSESEEHPDFLPDKYEAGTSNALGLVGLGAGVRWILEQGIEQIRAHEMALTERLLVGLQEIPGAMVYGGLDANQQTSTVAFNIAGLPPSDVGLQLDEGFEILCRVGLHCAPTAHRTIGTFPQGSVRFGLGYFNTLDEVERTLIAVRQIAAPAAT
jgi:cysteine desulfurase / selenocysteine lyase